MTIGNVIAAIIGYGFTAFILSCLLAGGYRAWRGEDVARLQEVWLGALLLAFGAALLTSCATGL